MLIKITRLHIHTLLNTSIIYVGQMWGADQGSYTVQKVQIHTEHTRKITCLTD